MVQRGIYTLLTLFHGIVGQSHKVELYTSEGIYLNGDECSIYALDCCGKNFYQHLEYLIRWLWILFFCNREIRQILFALFALLFLFLAFLLLFAFFPFFYALFVFGNNGIYCHCIFFNINANSDNTLV